MTEFVTNGIELLCIAYIVLLTYLLQCRPPDVSLTQTVLLCDTVNNTCSSTDTCLVYGYFNLDRMYWSYNL